MVFKDKVMSSTYLRFLSRNKLYTFIEVFGLSVALGFVILLASYARTEFSVGAKQPLSQRLYVVGAGDSFGMTLGTSEEFFPSIPEIKGWTRICDGSNADIMVGDDYYQAAEASIDTNFFKFFDYRLTGCPKDKVLENEDEVILSESFAKKVFGNESPIGRSISVGKSNLTVTGVIEDFGPTDVFRHFDMLTSIKCAQKKYAWMDNFGGTIPIVRLDNGTDVEKVRQDLLKKYMDYWDFYKADNSGNAFFWGSSLTRLDKVYFSGQEAYNILRTGDRKQVELLFFVALVLLISAIFNYINLTVAQTGKRAKEMATRRLLGESSRNIVARYIAESFAFTVGCFAVGCLLAYSFKPLFDRILSADIVLTPDLTTVLWAVLALVVISVISALLPALLVSQFKPIDVVKGEFRFKNKMIFGKVFIVLQTVFSTILIAMAITMSAQVSYLVNLPVGYETKDVIQVNSRDVGYRRGPQEALRTRLKALPQVVDAGLGITSPISCGANGLHDENNQIIGWMRMAQLDTTSLRILGIKVLEKYSEISSPKVLLTETSKRSLGVTAEHPYAGGSYTKGEYEICGIIPDFRANNALFEPMENERNSIRIIDENYDYAFIQLLKITGDRAEAMAAVKNVCREFAKETSGVPLEMYAYYLDEKLVDDLKGTKNTMLLVISFMVMAILISALGLFAMSLYFTEQQSRQIAVRKVFGAEVSSAVWTLSKSFMIMSLVAVVLAVPFAVWGITNYLQAFYTKIAFPWWAIVLAALISLLISFISVVGQTYAAATENPVKTLGRD